LGFSSRSLMRVQCEGICRNGSRCTYRSKNNTRFCGKHSKAPSPQDNTSNCQPCEEEPQDPAKEEEICPICCDPFNPNVPTLTCTNGHKVCEHHLIESIVVRDPYAVSAAYNCCICRTPVMINQITPACYISANLICEIMGRTNLTRTRTPLPPNTWQDIHAKLQEQAKTIIKASVASSLKTKRPPATSSK